MGKERERGKNRKNTGGCAPADTREFNARDKKPERNDSAARAASHARTHGVAWKCATG